MSDITFSDLGLGEVNASDFTDIYRGDINEYDGVDVSYIMGSLSDLTTNFEGISS